jgi:uncharacterized membrane protein HdeD (DUF308 family)
MNPPPSHSSLHKHSKRPPKTLYHTSIETASTEAESLTDVMDKGLKRVGVTVSKPVLALITILFGILVIVFPDILAVLVGVYLLIQGILLLFDYFELRRK